MSELQQVRVLFKPGMRVLELGGGNGFQAANISEWGCDVSSIDLTERTNHAIHFAVQDYDGRNIPFESEEFDIVFSSNVLEHVVDIERVLEECKRVLKPRGIMIHIMPTPSWRFWSIVSHYPYWIGSILKRKLSGKFQNKTRVFPEGTSMVFPPPHGEFRTSFHELYYYSSFRWKKVFEGVGFQVSACQANEIFCSYYALFPSLGIPFRKKLAKILGSSGNIFILGLK